MAKRDDDRRSTGRSTLIVWLILAVLVAIGISDMVMKHRHKPASPPITAPNEEQTTPQLPEPQPLPPPPRPEEPPPALPEVAPAAPEPEAQPLPKSAPNSGAENGSAAAAAPPQAAPRHEMRPPHQKMRKERRVRGRRHEAQAGSGPCQSASSTASWCGPGRPEAQAAH